MFEEGKIEKTHEGEVDFNAFAREIIFGEMGVTGASFTRKFTPENSTFSVEIIEDEGKDNYMLILTCEDGEQAFWGLNEEKKSLSGDFQPWDIPVTDEQIKIIKLGASK